MNRPILILGGGGHAKVLFEIVLQLNYKILGVVSPSEISETFSSLPHFNSDDEVLKFDPEEIYLLNGLGSLPGNSLRSKIFNRFKDENYEFISIVSPSATISPSAILYSGVQVMPGAIINSGAIIGENSIINTGAIIDHDCKIGASNHVAPGVTLSGSVSTGDNVHIGTGASIIQNICIGEHAVVGAGAVVTRDLKPYNKLLVARPFLIDGVPDEKQYK